MYFSNVFPFRSAACFYTKIYGYVLRESTIKINRLATKINQKKKEDEPLMYFPPYRTAKE